MTISRPAAFPGHRQFLAYAGLVPALAVFERRIVPRPNKMSVRLTG
jgi:hypothetical protein